MKKLLLISSGLVLSCLMASGVMAASCNGQPMTGGEVCYIAGQVVQNPVYTIKMAGMQGGNYTEAGWSLGNANTVANSFLGSFHVQGVHVAAWGFAPIDVTSQFTNQCGPIVDMKHVYTISLFAPSQTQLWIHCTSSAI